MLARVAGVTQFGVFSRWVCATGDTPKHAPTYTLQFFTAAEYKIIDQATEMIIPNDGTPGARDAGVSEFIDFMVAHDDDIQYRFRTGVAWLDAFATEIYGDGFANVSSEQREAILRRLAYRKEQRSTELTGQEFFKLLRVYTVMGYYTSRIGLEQLDYPGLRLYSASPECPHKDDPEHRHLPPPRF